MRRHRWRDCTLATSEPAETLPTFRFCRQSDLPWLFLLSGSAVKAVLRGILMIRLERVHKKSIGSLQRGQEDPARQGSNLRRTSVLAAAPTLNNSTTEEEAAIDHPFQAEFRSSSTTK